MIQPYPQFCGPAYSERSLDINAQRCVNWIPLKSGPDAKLPTALAPTYGLKNYCKIGNQPIRGAYSTSTCIYAVSGDKLYKILPSLNISVLGTLATSEGRVTMSYNNAQQVAVVDGSNVYVYDELASTFSTIAPGSNLIGSPTSIAFIDQWFLLSIKNNTGIYGNQAWQLSDLNDGTSYTNTNYALASSTPDELVAVGVLHRLVYLLKQHSTEVWYDAGSYPFPFAYADVNIPYGTVSPWSFASSGNALFVLSQNEDHAISLVKIQGMTAGVVSTPALNAEWTNYSYISDAYVFSYGTQGMHFVCVTFPSAPNGGTTFVYDVDNDCWHERSSYPGGQWAPSCHVANSHGRYYGDSRTGQFMIEDESVYTEIASDTQTENPIIRMRRSPTIWSANKRVFYSALQLDFEQGTGQNLYIEADPVVPDPSNNPQAVLRWSDDAGHTWTNEKQAPIGQIGNYKQRTVWRRLGSGRQRVFEVTVSDPVKAVITGASLDIGEGTG